MVSSLPLVPAQAGTQIWIPACAGMSGLYVLDMQEAVGW
jgi:hypothetical protein